MGSLIALGASGGLVPCPSALVVLLSAISLGRVGLGILLLVGFSAGLAVVLMGLGVLVLCVGNLLPASRKVTGSRAFQLLPVASAALIACVGPGDDGSLAGADSRAAGGVKITLYILVPTSTVLLNLGAYWEYRYDIT